MNETRLRDHLTIAGQLPDYVLGKLDETSLKRVARHLEVCDICRREATNAMVVLGLLAPVSLPSSARDAILRDAASLRPRSAVSRAEGDRRGVASEPVALRGKPVVRWLGSRATLTRTVAAAAVVLFTGFLGWNQQQRNANLPTEPNFAVVSDEATAYPLDDSDLSESVAGVVFAEPLSREVYIVANGLPVLPKDQRYQVWLFTADDKQESAGLFTVETDGELHAYLETPEPFADYVGVALTVEPSSGSPYPTSDLVLGGSFPPAIASAGSSSA